MSNKIRDLVKEQSKDWERAVGTKPGLDFAEICVRAVMEEAIADHVHQVGDHKGFIYAEDLKKDYGIRSKPNQAALNKASEILDRHNLKLHGVLHYDIASAIADAERKYL